MSSEAGCSFTLYVLVSNQLGILGYNFTYDTNDRWMFLRHIKTCIEKYSSEDPQFLLNIWFYFDKVMISFSLLVS